MGRGGPQRKAGLISKEGGRDAGQAHALDIHQVAQAGTWEMLVLVNAKQRSLLFNPWNTSSLKC